MDPATSGQMVAQVGKISQIANSDVAKVTAPSAIILLLAVNIWTTHNIGAKVEDNTLWIAQRDATIAAEGKVKASQQQQYERDRASYHERQVAQDKQHSEDRKAWQGTQTLQVKALTSLVEAVNRLAPRSGRR